MKKLLCLLLFSMAALTSAPAQIQTIVASTNSPTTPNPGGGVFLLGGIHTNSPDARFFRIQLVTNAGP